MANRHAPTEPTPRRIWGIPLRLQSLPRCRASRWRERRGSSGAGVVLAAIVGTPADRRAPREGGDV